MTPLPGVDPTQDERAAEVLEHLVADPTRRALAQFHTVEVDHLRRTGDVLVVHTDAGQVNLITTLEVADAAHVLREAADGLEAGAAR